MGWFDGFREHGHNTYYGDRRNPVLADVTHMVVILVCIMFSAALVLVIIGTRGREVSNEILFCFVVLRPRKFKVI